MAASFPIRIRGPTGVSTISLSHSDSVGHLLETISASTGIPVDQIEVRTGVPPKAVAIPSDISQNASILNIQRGDTLIVSASPTARTQSTQSAEQTLVAPSPPVQWAPSGSKKSENKQIEGTFINTASGNLVIRVVDDDNSCLFRAVGLVLFPGKPNAVEILRKECAEAIRQDAETFSDAILGKPRDQYIRQILSPNAWGGAIELSIISKRHQTEIAAADVQSGRIDRYGEEFEQRILLLYSGIHYDAVTLSPLPLEDFATTDFDTRIFDKNDESVTAALAELAAALRQKHYYTDTAKFTLRCEICREALVGEKDATQHAMKTGHQNFGEY